jgi:hypothetical protein
MHSVSVVQQQQENPMKNALRTSLVLACLLASGLQSVQVQAEPAFYREGLLELPQGIVIEEGQDQYYSNIRLRTEANGALRIVRAQPRRLITLEALELDRQLAPQPRLELSIAGYKSMPCVELEPVAIRRIDEVFHVLVAEAAPDPLLLCAQVLTPVELTVELDVAGLADGEYQVRVNNETRAFTLGALQP